MARQANILSFDEVKRGNRARSSAHARRSSAANAAGRPSGGSSQFSRRSSTNSSFASAPNDASLRPSSSSRRYASPYRGGAALDDAFSRSSSRLNTSGAFATPRRGVTPLNVASPVVQSTSSANTGRYGSTRRAASSNSFARTSAAFEDAEQFDELDEQREEAPKRSSRFEALKQAKRARAKSKAERAFEKQFAGTEPSADPSQAGPRAAVYKGEMGAKQRKATRMQTTSSQTKSKRATGAVSSESRTRRPKMVASCIVAACLALSCLFLYPTAQQYYQALRERDRLAAEYAALVERNSAIEGDVNALQTAPGIENQARDQLGWVKKGEQTAKVVGLEATERDNPAFRANVVSDSVKAPETWYSPFLDVVFGVE